VHQRGRLQCLAGHFARHLGGGQSAQFGIDHHAQSIGGHRVAFLECVEEMIDVAHVV
jgi:hypothetical protein